MLTPFEPGGSDLAPAGEASDMNLTPLERAGLSDDSSHEEFFAVFSRKMSAQGKLDELCSQLAEIFLEETGAYEIALMRQVPHDTWLAVMSKLSAAKPTWLPAMKALLGVSTGKQGWQQESRKGRGGSRKASYPESEAERQTEDWIAGIQLPVGLVTNACKETQNPLTSRITPNDKNEAVRAVHEYLVTTTGIQMCSMKLALHIARQIYKEAPFRPAKDNVEYYMSLIYMFRNKRKSDAAVLYKKRRTVHACDLKTEAARTAAEKFNFEIIDVDDTKYNFPSPPVKEEKMEGEARGSDDAAVEKAADDNGALPHP